MRLTHSFTIWALLAISTPAFAAAIDSRAYVERAGELIQAGRHALARSYLEPALIDFRLNAGERSKAYYLRGYSFYDQGMYVSALKDYNRALEFFPGNPVVLTAVAQLHLEGLGVDQNPLLGAAFLEQAAGAGHAPAAMRLGAAYLSGRGVDRDVPTARRWLTQAAQAGLAPAMVFLAQSYRAPFAEPPQPDEARAWYQKAHEAGARDALAYLGFMTETGEGGAADPEAARALFTEAAAAGSAVAQAKLGHLYLTGEGVGTDPERAHALFLEAAEQGHPTALMGLAYLYDSGTGVKADRGEALRWYEKAALAGVLDAQLRLAYQALAEDNLDGARRAEGWLARAAAQNSPRAINDYAWLLATSPFDEVRNGPQAVTLAMQAVGRERSPSYLDTLAAAYAETGKFDRAVATQREALKMADPENAELVGELRAHLDAFEAGKPWRE
ncbi:MAG: tetratricopeptide repeat protein [Pseudomonadales bacterium]